MAISASLWLGLPTVTPTLCAHDSMVWSGTYLSAIPTGVIMPRVVGTHNDLFKRSTAWDVIVEHTDLLVCFGGLALKNTGINHGGTTDQTNGRLLCTFHNRIDATGTRPPPTPTTAAADRPQPDAHPPPRTG